MESNLAPLAANDQDNRVLNLVFDLLEKSDWSHLTPTALDEAGDGAALSPAQIRQSMDELSRTGEVALHSRMAGAWMVKDVSDGVAMTAYESKGFDSTAEQNRLLREFDNGARFVPDHLGLPKRYFDALVQDLRAKGLINALDERMGGQFAVLGLTERGKRILESQ